MNTPVTLKQGAQLLALSSTLILASCGGDDNSSVDPASNDIWAAQLVASDYSSSQVAVGNLIGDRTATQGLMASSSSSYTISSYKNQLYHIGQYGIDTISQYTADEDLNYANWTYSTNEAGDSSANAYTLIQNADDNAYLIRYGASTIWQVDPTATDEANFIKDTIDLSAYTVTGERAGTVPNMVDAKIVNNQLFVAMQRFDAWWTAQQAYVAVIDLSTNGEVDTDTNTDGLKGIPVNATNPLALNEHNGTLYVVGRGDYASNSGALDKIDATTFEVTNLIDGTTLASLNGDETYHLIDVTVISDQLAYVTVNLEADYSYTTSASLLYQLNPSSTEEVPVEISLDALDGEIFNDITVDSESRLWIATNSNSNPGIVVMDTDTNTQNGDFIELDMPASKIVFLNIE